MIYLNRQLSVDDAITFVRESKKRSIHIQAGQSAPDKNDIRQTHWVTRSVRVTKSVALKYLEDCYRPIEKKCNVLISYSDSCLWIGW